jgi:hypothetical protein
MSRACRNPPTFLALARSRDLTNVSRIMEIRMMLRVPPTKKIIVATALFIVAACSRESAAPNTATTTPLVEQSAADPNPGRIEEFHGKLAPGGIAASYRATFSNGQIKSLEETRESTAQTGAYEFHGARLMKYQGAALDSAEQIQLEFDQQGKVLVNRAGDKEASVEEISAIRDRAQSLRSHAVATHDVRGHAKEVTSSPF